MLPKINIAIKFSQSNDNFHPIPIVKIDDHSNVYVCRD